MKTEAHHKNMPTLMSGSDPQTTLFLIVLAQSLCNKRMLERWILSVRMCQHINRCTDSDEIQ